MMTGDEAKAILDKSADYIYGDVVSGSICLDGCFTKEQLQAILVMDFADEQQVTQ